jgi:hypothetical protein
MHALYRLDIAVVIADLDQDSRREVTSMRVLDMVAVLPRMQLGPQELAAVDAQSIALDFRMVYQWLTMFVLG